ncbi:hypothetical protein [Bacillus sp. OG2]|uniref:hypothetical protein n=1 Tax=Bacillus infantis TaxID=324767 RepID=UPI000B9B67EC|nr:hypothetical protein B9K06_04635 [Bacillus sp. OG2]
MRRKTKKKIISEVSSVQAKHEKLRREAYLELSALEEYFSKRRTDKIEILSEILKHLEAYQKEKSYFGLRGIFIGLTTVIFAYLFNTHVVEELIAKGNEANLLIQTVTITLVSLGLYFIATSPQFFGDLKIRKEIYKTEYMIKVVQDRLDTLRSN